MAELRARGESDAKEIAIFLLEPNPPESVGNAPRVPMLDNGLTTLVGRLWFTAASVVSARYVDLPQDSDDEARVSFVSDQLSLGSTPALIFDPRPTNPELRWYPEGLGNLNMVETKPLSGAVSRSEVFDVIGTLHRQILITPNSMPPAGRLWESSSRCWVKRDAEALVQLQLKAGLAAVFTHCTIWHEQTQQTGRTDLEIDQVDPLNRGEVTRYAILELKVLRSFGSTGTPVTEAKTQEWIKEGVRQAAAYRIEKGSQWSALCCFDMRRDDVGDTQCFAQVRGYAARSSVTLRRWYLYSSAGGYRKAMTSSP